MALSDADVVRCARAAICPACNLATVAAIAYDMPAMDDELAHALEVGTVVLGECVLEPDAPVWQCIACEYHWKAAGRLGAVRPVAGTADRH